MDGVALTKGLRYTGTVLEITENASQFTASRGEFAGNKTFYCHHVLLSVPGFPEPQKTQWCSDHAELSQFAKGDDIKVTVTANQKGILTIKFEELVKTKMQKIAHQQFANTTSASDTIKEVLKDPGIKPSNPMVAGTLWSVCIGHAITLNKDRQEKKGVYSSMKDVIMDAELLMLDFKQKYAND